MTSIEQLRLWTASRLDIASCRKCLDRWPSRIDQALLADEIPNPSRDINILFVGVAPPPLGRKDGHEAGHFYSNAHDRLRLGLFNVLDQLFRSDLIKQNFTDHEVGTNAFIDAGFFFIHAAKVRPSRGKLAPDRTIMRFCATQHLANEIPLLRPKGICFLGTNAAFAAEAVFERRIEETPVLVEIGGKDAIKDWRGWIAVTVQPVRGTKKGSNRLRAAR